MPWNSSSFILFYRFHVYKIRVYSFVFNNSSAFVVYQESRHLFFFFAYCFLLFLAPAVDKYGRPRVLWLPTWIPGAFAYFRTALKTHKYLNNKLDKCISGALNPHLKNRVISECLVWCIDFLGAEGGHVSSVNLQLVFLRFLHSASVIFLPYGCLDKPNSTDTDT